MCPLISPASGALSSFILALMSECPVFHMTGLAPAFLSAAGKTSEHFTSKITGVPGPKRRTASRPRMMRSWSPQRISPDLVYRPDSIGIAVECDAQLRARAPHRRLKVAKVLRDRRIGVMVRKGAVGLAEQSASLPLRALEASERRRDSLPRSRSPRRLSPVGRDDGVIRSPPDTGGAPCRRSSRVPRHSASARR